MKNITNASLRMLFFFIAVSFMNCSKDDDPKNTMKIISIEPESPSELKFNDFVIITYEYEISNADGARMWIIPQTNGSKSPDFLYSSSKVFTGNGTRQVGVSIDAVSANPVVVDQLKVTMVNPDQSVDLFEMFLDVEYTFD